MCKISLIRHLDMNVPCLDSSVIVSKNTGLDPECPGFVPIPFPVPNWGNAQQCCMLSTVSKFNCGDRFFYASNPVVNRCVCEKKGFNCTTVVSDYVAFRHIRWVSIFYISIRAKSFYSI